jgi:hypothetical protein
MAEVIGVGEDGGTPPLLAEKEILRSSKADSASEGVTTFFALSNFGLIFLSLSICF